MKYLCKERIHFLITSDGDLLSECVKANRFDSMMQGKLKQGDQLEMSPSNQELMLSKKRDTFGKGMIQQFLYSLNLAKQTILNLETDIFKIQMSENLKLIIKNGITAQKLQLL